MDKKTINLFQSKNSDNWITPPDLYKKLNEEFHFTLDPCPINPDFNGLSIKWSGSVFVNPPYSKIELWLKKAEQELNNCEVIVFLVFSNTDTKWFHKYIYHKAEIRFIKGRLKFLNPDTKINNSAMRPSMICIFRNKKE